jgi:hypothetical protein
MQRARRAAVRASDLRRRGKREGGWTSVPERIRSRINLAARQAAANVMNDLAEAGPAYSGKFRDSWQAVAIGTGETSTGGYPYTTRRIPQLSTKVSEMKRVAVFEIANTSPYALYAMDLQPGRWRKPEGVEPLGGIDFSEQYPGGIKYGDRPFSPSFRGEVSDEDGDNVSTAEPDWYTNYVRGGALSGSVGKAVKLAFGPGPGVNIR